MEINLPMRVTSYHLSNELFGATGLEGEVNGDDDIDFLANELIKSKRR